MRRNHYFLYGELPAIEALIKKLQAIRFEDGGELNYEYNTASLYSFLPDDQMYYYICQLGRRMMDDFDPKNEETWLELLEFLDNSKPYKGVWVDKGMSLKEKFGDIYSIKIHGEDDAFVAVRT